MRLDEVVAALERLAPPALAEAWDRVGLLVEPAPGARVRRLLLTVDLTGPVLAEAAAAGAELVVAYHPPFLAPLLGLRASHPAERILVDAVRAGLAVYSPHTALDAAPGGLAEWLAAGLGPGTVEPLRPAARPGGFKVVVFAPAAAADRIREALAAAGAGTIGAYTRCSFGLAGTGTFLGGEGAYPVVGRRGRLERVPEVRLEMVCPAAALPRLEAAVRSAHPYEEPAWEVYPLAPLPGPAGPGRYVALSRPATLAVLARRLKRHLGLRRLAVAAATAHRGGAPIGTAALCPGAGGSLFREGPPAALYVTGELKHHDILSLTGAGSSVILAGHTETERGYLPLLRERLGAALGGAVEILLAATDKAPLGPG